ncbi:hypothetical protein TIFTF001_023382 [Ficus carica]|uniref:Myb-like domain-containing protein n=1 Tax=Ficus carica TaxID=3494 RepID=A0AA88ANE4_FICCA|nr:hypothetical protein TIFTF001_023382 [Ficus carica]
MVQKRPYDEEEIIKISFKHPRQVEVEQSKQLVSFSESVFPEDAPEKLKTLEKGFANASAEGDENLSGDICPDPQKGGEDIESGGPGSFSFSSWPTSSTSEEDSLSEAPFQFSFFPEYFTPERPARTAARCEDIYKLLLNYPPRKTVPIGPDHQANVPPWVQQCANKISSPSHQSEEASKSEVEGGKMLMGACIISMPELASPAYADPKVGKGRTDCSCEDKGSYSCVRKHIAEAREELVKSLGAEKFKELGFCDMGEQVAERWSEEEEQTFHQVVFYNPFSMGRNFWDKLSSAFPSRTKKEIVSYYFNVFMLQKRAEQNRFDPAEIDSDNDEWQGTDDFGDNGVVISEEDGDDMVVESPVRGDDAGNAKTQVDNLLECNEDVADDSCDGYVNLDSNAPKSPEISETRSEKLSNYGSGHIIQPRDGKGDQDVQDDSCTSSDKGAAAIRNQMESGNGNHCLSSFSGLSNHSEFENGHCPSRLLEHCDAKDWDVGYLSSSKGKFDFLPTCNMIEEVFGQETPNHKVGDGNS